MTSRELSYKDLGDLVGFTKQRVYDIFNNDTEGLNTSTVDKISLALGFKENALYDDNFKNKYKK